MAIFVEMFSGRRPGKRSIVGTRVCAPFTDGFYSSGVISAIQTAGPWEATTDRYVVEFEDGSKRTFGGDDIIGAGFQSLTTDRLNVGQTVFITHNGREVEGSVERVVDDEVVVSLTDNALVVLSVRTEDIRLMKSRRSARLSESQQDPVSMITNDSPFESSCKRLRPTDAAVASVSRSWPYNHWYRIKILLYTKTYHFYNCQIRSVLAVDLALNKKFFLCTVLMQW